MKIKPIKWKWWLGVLFRFCRFGDNILFQRWWLDYYYWNLNVILKLKIRKLRQLKRRSFQFVFRSSHQEVFHKRTNSAKTVLQCSCSVRVFCASNLFLSQFWLKNIYSYRAMNHYSKCEWSAGKKLNRFCKASVRSLTSKRLLFPSLRSVETFSMDVSMCTEISSIKICPIKPYQVKA